MYMNASQTQLINLLMLLISIENVFFSPLLYDHVSELS